VIFIGDDFRNVSNWPLYLSSWDMKPINCIKKTLI
jgi:hypothetical protein